MPAAGAAHTSDPAWGGARRFIGGAGKPKGGRAAQWGLGSGRAGRSGARQGTAFYGAVVKQTHA